MFEHKSAPLIPTHLFIRRLSAYIATAAGIVFFSLAIGTLGYRLTEHLSWIDAEYNAAMILTGMGPAADLKTKAGKIFASAYALFSGVVFLTLVALILGPVFHRFLHHFHLDREKKK